MKLVRDRIPQIIRDDGKIPITRKTQSDVEMQVFLYQKMIEELNEFHATPCVEEAADMYEVLLAICYHNKIDWEEMKSTATHKRNIRGGFDTGTILINVEEGES